MNINLQDTSFNTQYGEQYAITLEFELQREKEKNKILEQRLKNKEIFIVEMKKMQTEMQMLTEKCRNQLIEQRERRHILENITLREYLETISQLEHKVALLENSYPSQYNSVLTGADKKMQRNRSQLRINKQMQDKGNGYLNKENKQKQQINELLKNFANRFLEMYSYYNSNKEISQLNLKKNLKSGWKWIKSVVKQWQNGQNIVREVCEYIEKCKQSEEQFQLDQILRICSQRVEDCNLQTN